MFLLSVVMLETFVYSGIAFAEIANDESVVDQEITIDDVDFPVSGNLGHVIQPHDRGGCLSEECLGGILPGHCSSGNVATLVGGVAISFWKNCRHLA